MDRLLPFIPISNKAVSGKKEVPEKLTVQSFLKSEEKNDFWRDRLRKKNIVILIYIKLEVKYSEIVRFRISPL